MRAAWYERQGKAAEVFVIGEMTAPDPGPKEVRIRVAASGINPGEVKSRQDTYGLGMPYPRVVPHNDGAGVIEKVGREVASSRIGERVWCFGAQSYRPFGTAAESVVIPAEHAVRLPENVSFEQGACLGIPGITAYRAMHVAGAVDGKTVLVQGGAGAVGQSAVALGRYAGAVVICTVRNEADKAVAERAGAHHVVVTEGLTADELVRRVLALAPDGVDHIVEVAFHANISMDERLLRQGGSIAAYATGNPTPTIPFWPLVFKNVRLFFLGSDDFPEEVKVEAAHGLNEVLESGWPGFQIHSVLPLDSIAMAHEMVEQGGVTGRVVLKL